MISKTNLGKNGAAQAALLSTAAGLLTLALVNVGAEKSESIKTAVQSLGKFWMPGAEGIGPYSGKETAALLAWLISWFVLHLILRGREWNNLGVMIIFLVGIAGSTTLLWPPMTHLLVH